MKIYLILFSLFLISCSTTKQFTDGKYNDPTEVKLLDDKFNEADLQAITKDMSMKLQECFKNKSIKKVLFAGITNNTSEHLSTEMIADTIVSNTVNEVKYIHKKLRSEMQEEYVYETQGNVRKPAMVDHQSPDSILLGKIYTNIQEVGKDKTVYYLFSLSLTDFSTNEIICAQNKELRKIFKKQNVE